MGQEDLVLSNQDVSEEEGDTEADEEVRLVEEARLDTGRASSLQVHAKDLRGSYMIVTPIVPLA